MFLNGKLKRGFEVIGKRLVTVHLAPYGVCMLPDIVDSRCSIAVALFAAVFPAKGRLNSIGTVIREGKAYSARRGNGKQVAVADAVSLDIFLQFLRQVLDERSLQVFVCVEQRECSALFSEFDTGRDYEIGRASCRERV